MWIYTHPNKNRITWDGGGFILLTYFFFSEFRICTLQAVLNGVFSLFGCICWRYSFLFGWMLLKRLDLHKAVKQKPVKVRPNEPYYDVNQLRSSAPVIWAVLQLKPIVHRCCSCIWNISVRFFFSYSFDVFISQSYAWWSMDRHTTYNRSRKLVQHRTLEFLAQSTTKAHS